MRAVLLPLAIVASLGAQSPAAPDPFSGLRFLTGEWAGEGDGKPGASSGGALFRFELDGKVMVRRSLADIPAVNGRPASHHEDLMTVFEESGQLRALYVDNEGHVIRYLVSVRPDGATFTSEPAPGPRFRLTYLKKPDSLVTLRFEIAPPGKPEAFATYIEATTHRVK
ncbi:MAG: hypothetical protein LWW79_01925 [Holophagaceae bacterium]|nr:hypothetical protein [Holophagaceae bacterium]